MVPGNKLEPVTLNVATPQKRSPVKARTAATTKSASKATPKTGTSKRVRFEDRVFAGVHHKSGHMATIREVIASDIPTRTGRELSLDERVRLARLRIKDNDNFVSMMVLGIEGVIDKKRALNEIKKLSPVGLHLLEIDMRHAQLQVEQSLLIRAKKRRKNGSRNDGRN